MNKTSKFDDRDIKKVTVNTKSLMVYLDCGEKTAIEIGKSANARLQWGKRVLWDIEKIREFVHKNVA